MPAQAIAHVSGRSRFPRRHERIYSYAKYPGWPTSAWSAWSGGSSSGFNGYTWPIRRVTFRQPHTGWQMDEPMAEHYFRGSDDLAYDLPQRDDRPAIQNWDTANVSGTPTPLARQWTGDYSWIVTVVPTTNAARDGMARNPEGFAYDVSVVVFYKRVAADAPTRATDRRTMIRRFGVSTNERAVGAKVVSTGSQRRRAPVDGLR